MSKIENSKWTPSVDSETIYDEVAYKMKEQMMREIAEKMTEQMIRDRDEAILFEIFTIGWNVIRVDPKYTNANLAVIKEWTYQNTKGKFRWNYDKVAFEDKKDYEWFLLRWS